VGPEQSLLDYVQSGYAIQNGTIRKRLSGRLVLDDDKWVMLVISEDSVYYAFTKLTIDFKRGECDVSMLELPEVGGVGDNFITAWSNVSWDTFTDTDDLITSCIDAGAGFATTNTVPYLEDEIFILEVTYDGQTGNQGTITWGPDTSEVITGSGMSVAVVPDAAANGTSAIRLTAGAGASSYTNLLITVRKAYGY
jgi:hypothetical protein